MKVIATLLLTLIIALTVACNPAASPTAGNTPTLPPRPTLTPTPSPTATHTPTPEATATPTSLPTLAPTPTPEITPRINRFPYQARYQGYPFSPNHGYDRDDTYEDVFDLLIPSEQQCVQDTVGSDPRKLPFIWKQTQSYDPDNTAEMDFVNAMMLLCPSEAGHKERSFNKLMRDNSLMGLYPTEEETACAREVYNGALIQDDGDIDLTEGEESALLICVQDSYLTWFVRRYGAELEEVHPNSLNPVVENCLMDLALELELQGHIKNLNSANDDPSDDAADKAANEAMEQFVQQSTRCSE